MQQVAFDGGTRAVRLGDGPNATGSAAAIYRTFLVTQANSILRYSYALVLEDPGHPANQQPYFKVTATVGGNNVYSFNKVASRNDAFFTNVNNVLLRRWSCGVIDLTPYIGQVATVRFEASDCLPGGHYGYAYVDFPCAPPHVNLVVPELACENAPIMVDGTSNSGVVDHFWSVELSDENYGRNPSEEVMSWFTGPVSGPFDIAAFAARNGRPMTCGHYYRVKLAVDTQCDPWIETVKLVYVDCVPADAGPDRQICATGAQPVTLGKPPEPGVQYSWSANGVVLGNSSTLTVMPPVTTMYELTASNQNCTKKSTATVVVTPEFTPQITACYCAPSATTLTATIPGYSGPTPDFHWSTGERTQWIVAVQDTLNPLPTPTTYSVTVDAGCSGTASITLPGVPPLSLIAPNVIAPDSNIPENRVMRIDHLGMGRGEKPAYDATQYVLTVFDRWGQRIYEGRSSLDECAGIGNGDILWDATANLGINAGQIVPIGDYTYTLELIDCQEHLKQVKINGELAPSVTVLR